MKTLNEKLEKVISYTDCKDAFAVPGSDSIIDVIRPDTGRSWFYDQSWDEIRERYPGAEIIAVEEWSKQKAARQNAPFLWLQSTKAKYWDMLEVLPPAIMVAGGFLVGEPWDHHAVSGKPRFSAWREWHGKFFTASRPLTVQEFKLAMSKAPEQGGAKP
jgi:hypothetical protein